MVPKIEITKEQFTKYAVEASAEALSEVEEATAGDYGLKMILIMFSARIFAYTTNKLFNEGDDE